jgi:hypothetical protein
MKIGSVFMLVSAVSVPGGSPASFAQAAGDLSIEVGECVELESAGERLACFDRQVDAARTEQSESTGNDIVPGAQSAPDDSPVRGPRSPSRDASPARAPIAAEEAGQIVSRILALDERLPNAYLITLENGQTWRQVHSERYPLRVGHQVRVYPTPWGSSYRLTTEESKGFIQVERVR